MTVPQQIPSRADLDRLGVVDNRRAAHTLRTFANYYEALAGGVIPDVKQLGSFAEEAATLLRRGYVATALSLLELADRAEAHAAEYREALEEKRA